MYIDYYQIYVFSFFVLFFITKKIHYHTTNSSFHIENEVGARESGLKEYYHTCDYHSQEFQCMNL